MINKTNKKLMVTILSMSLLTVMAGAAVAPALNVIKEYFSDVNQTLVHMIISIQALFIALTILVFPKLSRCFKAKELVMIVLTLYVVVGCIAGLFSNIYVVLIFRAFVGIGVGIIMPLSQLKLHLNCKYISYQLCLNATAHFLCKFLGDSHS